MKAQAHYFSTIQDAPLRAATDWQDRDDCIAESQRKHAPGDYVRPDQQALPKAMRIVGVLAFAQSLIFVVIWLLICASAKAAPAKVPDAAPAVQPSTYEPTKTRDPFGRFGASTPAETAKAAPGAPVVFSLQGILYQPTDPSAIINE